MGNIVAIVGRPNVGKSTLFNRLLGQRKAITDNISGVTRDRIYGTSDWNGKSFTVIDTGGFVKDTDDVFEKAIKQQVRIAIEESHCIIFMVDVSTGTTDLDIDVADLLRRSDKPVFLAVNKVDNNQRLLDANEFWSLGFENTYFLSSITGSGTGELLDAVAEIIEDEKPEDPELAKFAIIGQPNVGKSSLTNAFLGEERNIVTDVAGTTRDSIHSRYKKFDKEFLLIDTAGIRKKNKVHEDLEFYSVIRAVKSVEEADVCFLLLDATKGVEAQDLAIFSLVIKRRKGLVILINKWDLVEKESNTAKEYEAEIKRRIAPFNDVPVLFISVLEKQRIFKAIELGLEVFENRKRKIKTSELNEFLSEIMEENPPPSHRGRFIKIKYATQIPVAYPSFAFFANHPEHVKASYKQYIENQIRKRYIYTGAPMSIQIRKK